MRVGLLFSESVAQKGGGFTYEQDLLRCFLRIAAESSHEYYVICEPGAEREFAQARAAANVRFAPLAARKSPGKVRSLAIRAARALGYHVDLRSRESEVVDRHGIEFLWSLGHYAHETFDVPHLTTVLDLQHRVQPWFPEVSRGRQWQGREDYFQRYIGRAAYVVTGTQEGKDEIQRFYGIPAARIRILPLATPGFCLEAPMREPGPRLRALGVGGRYLFYPAQFWSHKNHVNLLHALKILRDELGERMDLVLVGADYGNQAHVRSSAARIGVEAEVKFLGFVSQEDLVVLYRSAFALAYVTYFGPDNLPPLEAFALGCPVVASDVPGAREQLGDIPLFVDPSDPAAIAAAIKRLVDEPNLRLSMVERGRERSLRWTAPDYLRGIFSILDEFARVRRCWP